MKQKVVDMNDENKADEPPFFKSVGRCFMALKRCASLLLSRRSSDLSMEQIVVLFILRHEEGLDLTELAEKYDRDRTTATRMIGGLEKRNLVVKVPSKIDTRRKLIYLTHLAKEKLKELAPFAEEMQNIAMKGLNAHDVKRAQDVLDRIANNLEGKRN
jgi:DNA-binding MarR family transcriptional regulator